MDTVKDIPRLSPSIAKILLQKSPLHAWNAHRLLGGKESKPSAAQVKGKLIDSMVFAKPGTVVEYDCSAKLLDECQAIAGAVRDELESRGIVGDAQARFEWTNFVGANCSGVIDLFNTRDGSIFELKTCHDLSDWNIVKQIEQYGYDIQMAAYIEAAHTVHPELSKGLSWERGQFIFVETSEPYDIRFVSMTKKMYETGSDLWLKASEIWNQCLATDVWPGRGDFVADVSPYRKKQEAEDWLNQE